MTDGPRRAERWEGMAALPPSLPISLIFKLYVIARSSVIILNEMIDILSDEAIFNTGRLSLFSAIKQNYILNAASFILDL